MPLWHQAYTLSSKELEGLGVKAGSLHPVPALRQQWARASGLPLAPSPLVFL